ncbi:MAG: glycosyltransferase family 2 protein [Bacteroidia bacterium]|nr:glycosyltransferase family 2 protein [Bacteroidia bacterium]
MIKNKKISLVLPCRNEGTHLKEVLDRIPKTIDEILIVSNKSTDNTVEIARRLSKKDRRIIALEDNRTLGGIGYGYAHMTGIKKATGDIIMGADGDATYPIHDASKIVEYMLANNYDFISCNRYPLQDGVKIPFKLQLGVNLLNWEILLLYGIKIKDTLSGMWFIKQEVRDELHLTMGDWNLSPQIKINAARSKNIRFTEYGITQDQRLGETKQNYFKTGFNHAMWILKNRFVKF